MPPEIREALVTAGICTGIVYLAVLIGWLFGGRSGGQKGHLKVVAGLLGRCTFALRRHPGCSCVPSLVGRRGLFAGLLGGAFLWAEHRFRKTVREQAIGGRGAAVGDR